MTNRLEQFYRGRRVLVTGHTGFKGGWLTVWLKMLGAEVVGFALPAEDHQHALFRAAGIESGIVHIEDDVTDEATLGAVVNAEQPEVIFHLAAQPLVRKSYRSPTETFATNVLGTVNLLDAARRCDATRSVVVVTTDKCYKNQGQQPARGYCERDALGGHDPYSSSKACAELVVESFRDSYFRDRGIGLATARAGNVIGGGDWAEDRLVPDFVRAIIAQQPVTLRSPAAVRPWQHVLEPLYGYLLLGMRLNEDHAAFSSAWNFGPGADAHIPVQGIAERLVHYWGSGQVEIAADSTVHETQFLTLDSTKSRTQLGWRPCFNIDEAIEATAAWYRDYYEQAETARTLMEGQIAFYASRVDTEWNAEPGRRTRFGLEEAIAAMSAKPIREEAA